MKIIPSLLITFSFLAAAGCKKEPSCDNAELCVKNTGSDTIYYCWGCSFHADTLLPGSKACKNVGAIGDGSVIWADFDCSKGVYRIEVADCYVEKEIQ